MTATNQSALSPQGKAGECYSLAPGFTERDLATAWGLSADDLADLRKKNLRNPEDWGMQKNRVTYTPAGRARLLALLQIAAAGETPPAAAAHSAPNNGTGPALHPGDERDLVCVKRYWPNFRLVDATLGPDLQRVRVRDNKNFTPGMVLKCRYVQDNLWDLAQRLPRWRGKW